MTELWMLCEHGEKEPHTRWIDTAVADPRVCPGGHPATVEEVVEWLVERGEWPHGIAPTPVSKPVPGQFGGYKSELEQQLLEPIHSRPFDAFDDDFDEAQDV